MKPIVLDIVHPEVFCCYDVEDSFAYVEARYPRRTEQLRQLLEIGRGTNIPMHMLRQMNSGNVLQAMAITTLTDIYFGGEVDVRWILRNRLANPDGPPPNVKDYFMAVTGTPLSDEFLTKFPHLDEYFNPFLTQSRFIAAFSGMESSTHYVVGGLFSKCLMNWGNHLRKWSSEADIAYIKELSIDWSDDGCALAEKLVANPIQGRIISLEQAREDIHANRCAYNTKYIPLKILD